MGFFLRPCRVRISVLTPYEPDCLDVSESLGGWRAEEGQARLKMELDGCGNASRLGNGGG